MNKPLLLLAACASMACAEMSATITIAGSETTYATLSEAVAAAESGAVITIDEGYTQATQIVFPAASATAKAITIKGTDGVVVEYRGEYLFNSQNAANVINVENLIFKYIASASTTRSTFAIGRGSLNLKNVEVQNANITGENGVIMLNNGNSNIPAVTLDNVKLINCNVEAPAQVIVNNTNVVLAGDTELSLQLKGSNSIRDASAFTGKVELVLDETRAVNSVIVNNCTDATRFTVAGVSDKILLANNGNLVLSDVPVIVNETTSTGYSDIASAVKGANTGDAFTLYKDVTVAGSIDVAGKTIAITGKTGDERIIRATGWTKYFFLLNQETSELTLENLTIDGNSVEMPNPMLQPTAAAKLNLVNVLVQNCVVNNERGLIDNNNSNPGTWHFDGVKFDNCDASTQLVTANAAGNTIKGDNDFTLRVHNTFTVDASGSNNTVPVRVTPNYVDLGGAGKSRAAITNCADADQFTSGSDLFNLTFDNGTYSFVQKNPTGVENIEINGAATIRWYNLRGEETTPSAAGVYIKVEGNKATKVYVK